MVSEKWKATWQAYATLGNYNNYIGVPLTLLDAPIEAEWWVIEIGSNNFGEIAELSKIVRPTGGVITNIGESHLEFLLDTDLLYTIPLDTNPLKSTCETEY